MGLDVFGSIRATRPSSECDWLEQSFVANLGAVIQSVGAMNEREGLAPVDGASSPRDWDALIAHVRKAAHGPGTPGVAASQVRQREAQAQALLRSAHRRLDEAAAREAEAEARVEAAEGRARAAEMRAAAMIEAAEARARQAEEAARSALDWLQRLRQAEAGSGPAVLRPPALRLRRIA